MAETIIFNKNKGEYYSPYLRYSVIKIINPPFYREYDDIMNIKIVSISLHVVSITIKFNDKTCFFCLCKYSSSYTTISDKECIVYEPISDSEKCYLYLQNIRFCEQVENNKPDRNHFSYFNFHWMIVDNDRNILYLTIPISIIKNLKENSFFYTENKKHDELFEWVDISNMTYDISDLYEDEDEDEDEVEDFWIEFDYQDEDHDISSIEPITLEIKKQTTDFNFCIKADSGSVSAILSSYCILSGSMLLKPIVFERRVYSTPESTESPETQKFSMFPNFMNILFVSVRRIFQ